MKFGSLGLQGKFVVALLVAAALPFLLGLLVFETTGYRHLLSERGKLHHLQAAALARELEQASGQQAVNLRTWLAADPALLHWVSRQNDAIAARPPAEVHEATRQLDKTWESLPPGDPQVAAVLNNPGAEQLRQYLTLAPQVAEILATDHFGRLVAATGKTSDFDQADEAWWQKGATLKPGEKWIDVLRFDASSAVFSLDAVLPLYDDGALTGVVKLAVDVTSLFTAEPLTGNGAGERWEIALADGSILASSQPGFAPRQTAPLADLAVNREGWTLVQNADDEPRLAGFVPIGDLSQTGHAYVLFSSRRDDVVGPLRQSFLEIGVVAIGLLGLCALAGFGLIRTNILRPLARLGHATRAIAATARLHPPATADEQQLQQQREQVEADLHLIQNIRTGDEIQSLAEDLAVMTSRVLRYHRELEAEVAAKTAVIHDDLEMAREFQFALLPSHYPEVPPPAVHNPLRLQFAHFYQPASTVGGDFFDLLELDQNRAGILIADVMGHGARSALVTAILRALVRNHTTAAADPGLFLAELNAHLRDVISRSGQAIFVTAFFLVLDTRQGRAAWSVAGHPAPLWVRRGSGKPPQPLWSEPQHQPALGLIEGAVYHTTEIPLAAGDLFLLYTDGLVEAENPDGQRFGTDRLIHSCDEALDGPMAAMPAKIVCDVSSFQKRRHYADDVCLVTVEAVHAP